jgi:hypothetical protein
MRIVIASLLAAALFSASSARAEVVISIDKSAQRMTVAQNGLPLYDWPVSTGKRGYATPSGAFTAFRMEADHYSQEWDDAPMPHSIFFTKIGHAIHGSYDTKKLGTPASHGCVRLSPANAATLYALVRREGVSNAKVVLSGSEQVFLARQGAPANGDEARAARQPRPDANGYETGRRPAYPGYRQAEEVRPRYADPDVEYRQRAYARPRYAYPDDDYARPRYGNPYPYYAPPQYVQPYGYPYSRY